MIYMALKEIFMKNKRQLQENAIIKLLETSIAISEFHKANALNDKNIAICDKHIRSCKKALRKVKEIKHEDIVNSLFKTLTANAMQLFIFAPQLINSKQVKIWDTTKKGYDEFLYLEEEARKINEEKEKQRLADKQAIEKAKAEGKKVDLIYKDGQMRPVITEEKNNA